MRNDQRNTDWVGVVALLLAGICFAIPLVTFLSFLSSFGEFDSARTTFPQRHEEATAFIEAVYRFHDDEERWPSNLDIKKSVDLTVPANWEYMEDCRCDNPCLILWGQFHMFLWYYFTPSRDPDDRREWIFSVEGSERPFLADTTYDGGAAEEERGAAEKDTHDR